MSSRSAANPAPMAPHLSDEREPLEGLRSSALAIHPDGRQTISAVLRLALSVLASFGVASSVLGYPVSVSTSGTSTVSGGQVLFSSGLTSFFPPEPTSLSIADSGPVCPPPPVVCGIFGSGHGEAFADLSTGMLGVYVSGWHGDADIYTFISHASFIETLEFHLPPGMLSTQITLTMSIDADLPAQAIHGRVLGGALLAFGQDGAGVNFQAVALAVPSHFSQILQVTTTVTDRTPIDVFADLTAILSLIQTDHGTYVVDALHTAALSISVPAGVTYESNSGVFLTQVPEPGTGALLAAGMLGLSAASRARRARRPELISQNALQSRRRPSGARTRQVPGARTEE